MNSAAPKSVMDQIDAQIEAARAQAYNAAINDCIGLLRKWFWGTNKEARGCEADFRKLEKR